MMQMMMTRSMVVCPVLMAAGAARAQISRDVVDIAIQAAENLSDTDRPPRALKNAPVLFPTDRQQLAMSAAK
jgi:hypothetical protein